MLNLLRRNLAYDTWALERFHDEWPTPEPPDFSRLLNHMVGAREVWLQRATGQPAHANVWPTRLPHESRVALQENHHHWLQLLAQEPDLNAPHTYTNSFGETFEADLEQVLSHLTAHAAYHRGQLARLLREAGYTPPRTDFIHYLRNPQA